MLRKQRTAFRAKRSRGAEFQLSLRLVPCWYSRWAVVSRTSWPYALTRQKNQMKFLNNMIFGSSSDGSGYEGDDLPQGPENANGSDGEGKVLDAAEQRVDSAKTDTPPLMSISKPNSVSGRSNSTKRGAPSSSHRRNLLNRPTC